MPVDVVMRDLRDVVGRSIPGVRAVSEAQGESGCRYAMGGRKRRNRSASFVEAGPAVEVLMEGIETRRILREERIVVERTVNGVRRLDEEGTRASVQEYREPRFDGGATKGRC